MKTSVTQSVPEKKSAQERLNADARELEEWADVCTRSIPKWEAIGSTINADYCRQRARIATVGAKAMRLLTPENVNALYG